MKAENSRQKIQNNSQLAIIKPKKASGETSFAGGPLDGIITQSLMAMDTNPMVNAALVDVFSMVAPRTYVDTKERNKYAGAETFFREISGTIIICLSSGVLAKGIAHLYNKFVDKDVKINPNSWQTNDSLNLLHHSWKKNQTNEKYVKDVLSNISGVNGENVSSWKDINWKKVEWHDDAKWSKLNWKDSRFSGIENKLKDGDSIIKTLAQTIGENVDSKDIKQVLQIAEHRITNALQVGGTVDVTLDDKKLASPLSNLLRDVHDLGKNVFNNKNINVDAALNKLTKMNKFKALGALTIASTLGLTNQYVNRWITKKRTGSSAFVGDMDYIQYQDASFAGGAKNKEKMSFKKADANDKKDKAGIWSWKLLASAGIVTLATVVMRIKSPKDFIKKLEFTSPMTSGNAIKTVYTATIVGRFLAADNKTELRESATRDYMGFLNWLVFGGFVSKGVANLMDKEKKNLFNIHKQGKGLKHWLNDISLKSHAEIAAKGKVFAKEKNNIRKLNIAHASGLLYSTIALGILLPKLNIAITKRKHKEKQAEKNK